MELPRFLELRLAVVHKISSSTDRCLQDRNRPRRHAEPFAELGDERRPQGKLLVAQAELPRDFRIELDPTKDLLNLRVREGLADKLVLVFHRICDGVVMIRSLEISLVHQRTDVFAS